MAMHYSRKLERNVNASTVQSIRIRYEQEMKKRQSRGEYGLIAELPCKKKGKNLLPGPHLENQVQAYLRRVRQSGGIVT